MNPNAPYSLLPLAGQLPDTAAVLTRHMRT